MKIIVTGGAGFIGSNFVHHMVNKYPDYEIINLDLLTYAGNLENLKPVEDKPNYKFVKGDIADRKFIFELFEKEKPDVVVNFAAESHVDRSITDPEAFVRTNVKKGGGSHDIGPQKGLRVCNGTVHMALGGKVYHHIRLFLLKQLKYKLPVGNVALYKFIIGLVLNRL